MASKRKRHELHKPLDENSEHPTTIMQLVQNSHRYSLPFQKWRVAHKMAIATNVNVVFALLTLGGMDDSLNLEGGKLLASSKRDLASTKCILGRPHTDEACIKVKYVLNVHDIRSNHLTAHHIIRFCKYKTYYNYKGYHTIVRLRMQDAAGLFIPVGDFGRNSDNGVFPLCIFRETLSVALLAHLMMDLSHKE